MFQQILRLEGHIQNIYLVVYADKLLLLDGCCRCDVPLILDTIRHTLGRDVRQLKAVIVTHMHADHAGGAPFLRMLTGCKIISADKPTQWYAGVVGAVSFSVDLSLSYFVAHRQGKKLANLNYPRHLYPDIVVKDGDSVPMFEDWQIVETAGHTDRDLSVYHVATGKIYVADLMILLHHNKYVNPYNIHDPITYKQSLIRVQEMQPSLVIMAHGGQAKVTNADFDKLVAMAPNKPRTYKDIAKQFLGGMLGKKIK